MVVLKRAAELHQTRGSGRGRADPEAQSLLTDGPHGPEQAQGLLRDLTASLQRNPDSSWLSGPSGQGCRFLQACLREPSSQDPVLALVLRGRLPSSVCLGTLCSFPGQCGVLSARCLP